MKETHIDLFICVIGMYRIDINSEEGLFRLQAVVEPNIFLKALAGTGSHAKPISVKINHPKFYNTYSNGYNANNYNAHGSSNRRALPDQPYRTMEPTYPHCNGSNPYYYGSNSNYHGSGPPQQRYFPTHPPLTLYMLKIS